MLCNRSLLVFHFIYSSVYIRESSGTPLQCSCLENPRDRGAWWAAVYGVAHDWSDLAAAAAYIVSTIHTLYFCTLTCLIDPHSLPFLVSEEKIRVTAVLLIYCTDTDLHTWFHILLHSLRPSLHLVCRGVLFIQREQIKQWFGLLGK